MNARCDQLQLLSQQWPSSSKEVSAFELHVLTIFFKRVFSKTKPPSATWWQRAKTRYATWRQRAKGRSQLAAMSSAQMKDIGLTLSDARQEANKEFWTA